MTAPRGAVIGSGFGGLAAAIRLQAGGFATTIYERRDKPGGRAYVFEDDGFVFDAGPTVITDPSCIEELFAVAGRSIGDYVTLIPVTPFYRLMWDDRTVFDYDNDQVALERQIAALSPLDVEGYRSFMRYSQEVFTEGYLKLGHVPFPDFRSMLRVAPQLVKLGAYRSVYSMVSRYISHPLLRQAFSFHSLLVGGNPMRTSAIYALIHALERRWGVFFPKGGTGQLVAGLVRLFQDIGGTIRLASPVERIVTEGARVTGIETKSGGFEPYDVVVSNGDVVHTYAELLRDSPRGRDEGRRLRGKRFSNSLFVVYFGLRGHRPNLRHHTVIFGPRYQGLLRDIFDHGRLADDFSLYLHAPSVTDPSLAPTGCSTYYALVPVPHLGKGKIDWPSAGPAYRDRVLDRLEATCIPGLRRDLHTIRIFTPVDFKTELGAHLGSAFSLEPVLMQSAYFRTHNRDDRLRNLYFAGAGTHPGAGIPGVIGSAKATAAIVLADQRMAGGPI